jgi:hypothetical protein
VDLLWEVDGRTRGPSINFEIVSGTAVIKFSFI